MLSPQCIYNEGARAIDGKVEAVKDATVTLKTESGATIKFTKMSVIGRQK